MDAAVATMAIAIPFAPEPRDRRAGNPDQQRGEEPHVRGIALAADDTDREVRPDREEHSDKRQQGATAVRPVTSHPNRQLERDSDHQEHHSEGNKVAQCPGDVPGELHRDERQGEQRSRAAPADRPPRECLRLDYPVCLPLPCLHALIEESSLPPMAVSVMSNG